MTIIVSKTFSATITFGMQIGYTEKLYSKDEFINNLQKFQKKQIFERNIYLSACISKCEIVLNGQIEPHIKLDFINYPKFPLDEGIFKYEIELLTTFLMDQFNQNRVVIVYHDETKMLEQNSNVNPKI